MRLVTGYHQLAVFFSDESAVGFYMSACDRATLFATILRGMFDQSPPAKTLDVRAEVEQIEKQLLANGAVQFDNGWIELRTGVEDVAAFFMEKFSEAKAEEQFADEQRFVELQGRHAAEQKYNELRDALRLAIGSGAKAANLHYTLGVDLTRATALAPADGIG